ncbi:hypothetical protein [Saccharopolyspora pogona]|uniref:hypothetical protein n=1 Tax=Saccharopolyspora pogona TaxID=333966 RepID=UPI001CC267BC|nr:hypothetical protein [Saccharopolyspora pogona]
MLCLTCGGLRKLGEPRMYVVQATEDMRTGMTMGEWRTRPQCQRGPPVRPASASLTCTAAQDEAETK